MNPSLPSNADESRFCHRRCYIHDPHDMMSSSPVVASDHEEENEEDDHEEENEEDDHEEEEDAVHGLAIAEAALREQLHTKTMDPLVGAGVEIRPVHPVMLPRGAARNADFYRARGRTMQSYT